MKKKQWYESLFENYGQTYDNEIFTQGTIGECDFIENELNHNTSLTILDVGCGTGRHAIELTKRGFSVTGIDFSETQLKRATEKAKSHNLTINFQQQDARKLTFTNEFDAAIMLCEGGFPLMETDEMNFEILKRVTISIKEQGNNITEIEDDLGNKKTLECNERYYVPCEITWLLKTLGFKKIDIFGAKLGQFSRDHKLTTEDFEMLIIAEK